MASVEIYTQAYCPFCDRALALLSRKRASVTERPAPQGSEARRESVSRSGGRSSVPQIFIGSQHIGGCDDLMALERAGKLDALLGA